MFYKQSTSFMLPNQSFIPSNQSYLPAQNQSYLPQNNIQNNKNLSFSIYDEVTMIKPS